MEAAFPVKSSPLVESVAVPLIETLSAAEQAEVMQVDASPTVQPAEAAPVGEPRIQSLDPTMAVEPLEEVVPRDRLAPVAPESERFARGPVEPTAELPGENERKPLKANVTDTGSGGQKSPLASSSPEASGETGLSVSLDRVANLTSDGGPGIRADYLHELRTWLEKHKEYPFRAWLRRQEGTALLYFVVDRNGELRDYELRKGTGYALLDQEVIAMVRRAQPLPRVPAYLNQPTLEVLVPVQFSLQ